MQKIHLFIKKYDIDRQELAENAGVNIATVYRAEKAEPQRASPKIITALIKHYDMSPEWFFLGDGPPKAKTLRDIQEVSFALDGVIRQEGGIPPTGHKFTEMVIIAYKHLKSQRQEMNRENVVRYFKSA